MSQDNKYAERDYKLCVRLSKYAGWNEFARSLIEFYNEAGFLTPKQAKAGENLVMKGEQAEWSVDMTKIKVVDHRTDIDVSANTETHGQDGSVWITNSEGEHMGVEYPSVAVDPF